MSFRIEFASSLFPALIMRAFPHGRRIKQSGCSKESPSDFSNLAVIARTIFSRLDKFSPCSSIPWARRSCESERSNTCNARLERSVSGSTSHKFEDLEEMSVKSLQELCREYKLKIKGRKDELIARIKEYLSVDKL